MLDINSNGSKWAGQQPDSIEALIETLKQYTLDPTFEKYGDFVNKNPHWLTEEINEKYKGCTSISGNFYSISHVFNIITDDKNIIDQIVTLVIENKQTEAYKQAKISIEEREKEYQKQVLERINKLNN